MYQSFYGLTDKPFQLNPDPSFYFGSREHRRAMAYLEYGLHQNEGFIVVTGDVGTGKTTLIRSILGIRLSRGIRAVLAAPTGRAAKRMAEATGHEAKTIHRLLESSGGMGTFQRNEENPLEGDLLIVDEASMLDTVLMNSLLKAALSRVLPVSTSGPVTTSMARSAAAVIGEAALQASAMVAAPTLCA